ncbi:MAG: aminotransferase class IV [Sedimentisphaerales bacterium]|nr:aminotransferase class IV [Sedimentisphaerales bacterium]
MAEYVYLNDSLVDTQQARVSVHDGGLLHAVGLFETMRSYEGVVFQLDDHLERLFKSAAALNLSIARTREEICAAVTELLEANDLQDARLRLTLTRGNIQKATEESPPVSTLIITATRMAAYAPELYRYGMTVIISPYKQNPDDPLAGHKTINYFARLIALQQAQMKKAGEALWFSTTNRLAEGCISNVFLVKNEVLLTPPPATPVLEGITRNVVMELARENAIECREEELVIKDLLDASEVILTNSIMEVMPVCRVEAHKVGQEKPGPFYQRLHELYCQEIEKNL